MGWLPAPGRIEVGLARRHPRAGSLVPYDLTRTDLEGYAVGDRLLPSGLDERGRLRSAHRADPLPARAVELLEATPASVSPTRRMGSGWRSVSERRTRRRKVGSADEGRERGIGVARDAGRWAVRLVRDPRCGAQVRARSR